MNSYFTLSLSNYVTILLQFVGLVLEEIWLPYRSLLLLLSAMTFITNWKPSSFAFSGNNILFTRSHVTSVSRSFLIFFRHFIQSQNLLVSVSLIWYWSPYITNVKKVQVSDRNIQFLQFRTKLRGFGPKKSHFAFHGLFPVF